MIQKRAIPNLKYTMQKFIFLFLVLLMFVNEKSAAQIPTEGLTMYYAFDGYPFTDSSGNTNKIIFSSDSALVCGVEGQALNFNGINTQAFIIGPAVFDNFKVSDFTLSFYMKVNNLSGNATLDVLSKRPNCNFDSCFAIRYTPSSNQISLDFSENISLGYHIVQRLDYNRCWQHIAIVRNYNRLLLYVNGRLVNSASTNKRVNITNNKPLAIAAGPCLSTTDKKFNGAIDELRIYDRPLSADEIKALYFAPDRIANRDTVIFLGSTVPLRATNTCSADFQWTPANIMSDAKTINPTARPTQGGFTTVKLVLKELQCTAVDSVKIKVIDPKDLECNTVYFPKAFTPNGDERNDLFFISNPYAIEDLTIFEIFDGYGGQMFSTTDKFARWDGTFHGQPLNPGVYLWKVRFKCRGQDLSQFGSVTILK